MKAAPGADHRSASVPCTLADAREIGTGTAADKAATTIYEIACKEGLGYIIGKETKAGAPLLTYNCLMTSMPDGGRQAEQPGLPAARQRQSGGRPAADRQPERARSCTVDKARYLGPTPDKQVYEVACQNGKGLVLLVPIAGGAPEADNCLAYSGGPAPSNAP